MTGMPEGSVASNFAAGSSTTFINKDTVSVSSEPKFSHTRSSKASLWPSFFPSTFSIFDLYAHSSSCEKKEIKSRTYGWTAAVKKAMSGGSMRRLQERILGTSKTDLSSSTSEIWLLGACYKVSPEESSSDADIDNGLVGFLHDFSSRIWITYRKGFDAIGDSKFTSDVNWGCMIRSSQMLVAQALLVHYLGRSWRRTLHKPYEPEYIELLHLFGDSEASTFSIHKLLQAGRGYGLSAGSWVGPYAMCRSWEILARMNREHTDTDKGRQSLPMAVYVVSGEEDGERGGAPVVYIDVASRLCSDFCNGQLPWAPILLLVPLVLGLDKVNPRYLPLIWATFTFPQSLGVLGGKPGASTYLVGVQDDRALYLDPHEVQPVVEIPRNNLEADTSSYHCSTVRNVPLDQIDPSLAIGFYCRDKDDFDDFCARACELVERSNGAPLFTVAQCLQPSKSVHQDDVYACHDDLPGTFDEKLGNSDDAFQHDDDWQLL